MTFADATSPPWSLPLCPQPPDWSLDWDALLQREAWLPALADTPQDLQHHAEGDVLTHTRMVVEALLTLPAWRTLPAARRAVLFAAALLHDVAKPGCTQIDAQGRVSSPGHARLGERLARALLWRNAAHYGEIPFPYREQVAQLVRRHGLPLWFLDKADPTRALIAASQVVRLDDLALLAEADARGRVCADGAHLLDRIALFRQFAAELECFDRPRDFASDHSRFVYFRNPHATLDYDAYDDRRFEVVVMSGLPAAGKDSWVRTYLPDWPMISLDAVRAELRIAPNEPQGAVVRAAKQRARALLQRGEPFVWYHTTSANE